MSLDVNGQWVMITGAAGGIGSAMALDMADRGANLVLTDLVVETMQAVAGEARSRGAEVICLAHDVSLRERWVEIADELDSQGRLPRVLINNAGVAAAGTAMDLSEESWKKVIDIDLWGVIYGCRVFVPRMLASGWPGAVMNVASASAYVGLPFCAPYFVAKAGVLRLTQSLQSEIDPKRVSFTCLCPGPVGTGIGLSAARLGAGSEEDLDTLVAWLAPKGRTPDQVAKKAVRGVLNGRAVVNVYSEAYLLDLVARVLPHQLLARVNRRYFMYKFPELA